MKKLKFTKMVGAGNDFVVIDCRSVSCSGCCELSSLAKNLCQIKTGIGADGLLILEKSRKADFRMRIFNADGSEAEMCGNGLRCAALYAGKKGKVKVETQAGIYEAAITGKDKVRIKMEEPKGLKMNLPLIVNGRSIKVGYVDTGVPHTVVFVQGIEKIDVDSIGRAIRYHKEFKPRGTNADFVEIIDNKNIKMRTYERGVEGETLACGTGAVASAIIAGHGANVHTKGGILKVSFKRVGNKIKDVYLEGEAREVYTGEVEYV
ncbi:MAG: diaminopimelate epimerase [Candidatus Omnitrophica bacterium]|nr:diaminopimelate epimerase [Candidatus Omnitrophota bacterium]MBU4589865.1 diaminopimelate epimerase [Candidatus Omnitrophota bacterium]